MKIDKIFQKKEFGICGNNSYSYIASFLNEIQYNGRNNYTEKDIFFIYIKEYIKESKYISSKGVIFNYLTLIIIAILIIIIIILNV